MTDCYYWVQTYSGRKVRLDQPTPDMIDMDDIAHHLALINRFAGATREPYSVAEHSIRVSNYLIGQYPDNRQLALYGLLHDAHEAYLGDLISPARRHMASDCRIDAYIPLARSLDRAIFLAAGLPPVTSTRTLYQVAEADAVLLDTEARDLLMSDKWAYSVQPLDDIIRTPLSWRQAKTAWMSRYTNLTSLTLDTSGDVNDST